MKREVVIDGVVYVPKKVDVEREVRFYPEYRETVLGEDKSFIYSVPIKDGVADVSWGELLIEDVSGKFIDLWDNALFLRAIADGESPEGLEEAVELSEEEMELCVVLLKHVRGKGWL